MVRGPVVAADARAWSTGHLRSSDYFAMARQRALAKASDTVRRRLRRIADGDDTQRAARSGDHQDDADRVDVEAGGADVHGEGEDGADHQQEDAHAEAHRTTLSIEVTRSFGRIPGATPTKRCCSPCLWAF